jgi:hypothetical protein
LGNGFRTLELKRRRHGGKAHRVGRRWPFKGKRTGEGGSGRARHVEVTGVVQAGARRHAQAMGGGGSRADSGAAEVGAVRRRVRQAHGERER